MVGDDFGNKSGGIRYIPQGCRYHIRFVRFPYPADRARRGILDDHEGNFVLTHQIPVIGACLQDVWTIRARGSSRSERDICRRENSIKRLDNSERCLEENLVGVDDSRGIASDRAWRKSY